MEAYAFDEGRYGLVVENLRNLEAHIRDASDVVTQGLILPVPYPLKVIFISGLLAGTNEVIDKCLAQFLPRIKRVLGQTKEPLVAGLIKDDWKIVRHDMLVSFS